ncbi:MAG: glycosyltransferase family 4 protein [Patescibacteria group bacterium]
MKIVFWLASCLPELGGLQWSTYRLARALQKNGYEILFLTRLTEQAELIQDCQIIRLPGDSIPEWTENSGRWLFEHKDEFDIIHTVDLFYQAIDLQFASLKRCAKPTVLKIPTAGYIPRLIASETLKLSLQSINAIITLNDLIQEELIGVGVSLEAIYCIPNGIDADEFIPAVDKAALRRSLDLPLDKILLIFAGRFVARKRLDILLAAIAEMNNDVRLIMVGSGFGQRDSIEESIIKVALQSDKVITVQAVNDCRPYFQASDIQILLSEREGLSNSLLEGMSCALPTIATDIPGINNVITNDSEGILVPVGAVSETSLAIKQLSPDEPLRRRLGNSARARIIRTFSLEQVVKQYHELYQKIIKQERRRL